MTPEAVLQAMEDDLANERELGRQRMVKLGISAAHIEKILAAALLAHREQLASARRRVSQVLLCWPKAADAGTVH